MLRVQPYDQKMRYSQDSFESSSSSMDTFSDSFSSKSTSVLEEKFRLTIGANDTPGVSLVSKETSRN